MQHMNTLMTREAAAYLRKSQLEAQLRREERRRKRADKRAMFAARFYSVGLNGKRAVARRLRQIAAGSIGAANGLTPA